MPPKDGQAPSEETAPLQGQSWDQPWQGQFWGPTPRALGSKAVARDSSWPQGPLKDKSKSLHSLCPKALGVQSSWVDSPPSGPSPQRPSPGTDACPVLPPTSMALGPQHLLSALPRVYAWGSNAQLGVSSPGPTAGTKSFRGWLRSEAWRRGGALPSASGLVCGPQEGQDLGSESSGHTPHSVLPGQKCSLSAAPPFPAPSANQATAHRLPG